MRTKSRSNILCPGFETFTCTDEFNMGLLDQCTNQEVKLWMKNHKLTYQQVFCAKGHDYRPCSVVNNRSIGLLQSLRSCTRSRFTEKPSKASSGSLKIIVGMSRSQCRKDIHDQTSLSVKSITVFTHAFEALIAEAHDIRFERAAGTARFIQKDATCFSRVKIGGCNRCMRVRTLGVVENTNSQLKSLLRKRGNRLGNTYKQRDHRVKFTAEIINGLMKNGMCKGLVSRRLFADIAIVSDSFCIKEVSSDRESGISGGSESDFSGPEIEYN